MGNLYLPEGKLLEAKQNKELTSSLSGLQQAMKDGTILEAKAVLCDSEHNLYVDVAGYRAVIPKAEAVFSASGEEVRDIAIITRVGKCVSFVVTDITERNGCVSITLSRRLAQLECCQNRLAQLECGDIINAVVTHLEPFGAFCDIGCGCIALLPVDCISVSRIGHPSDRFFCGQEIRCAVKNIDRSICRVTLTHKELLGTWEENAAAFHAGETVTGIIRSIEAYGIFIELSPNIAGLAEWCDGAEVGQSAVVYIKSIIPEKMKVKLVIVDISGEDLHPKKPEYFFEGNRIERWDYSPEGCAKKVFTDFNL